MAFQDNFMKKRFILLLIALVLFSACNSTSPVKHSTTTELYNKEISSATNQNTRTVSLKNPYKGKNLVIAVTLPKVFNETSESASFPQYFQDSITGKLAKFSKMTVLDRKNESLIKAEQELSETGYYSEESAAQIGQMTNSQLVVVGNIQQIAGLYEVNFRVNDVTTNEIKASVNNRYSLTEMQNGKAVNEISQNLLESLGIELSDKEKAELSKVNSVDNKGALNLAKGVAFQNSDEYIKALDSFSKVSGYFELEAKNNITEILSSSIDTMDLQERITYYNILKDKWNKIFLQLETYMNENVAYVVYDFSYLEDKVDMVMENVHFSVKPGIKCVPNAVAMKVFSAVYNEWQEIISDKNNTVWTRSVTQPHLGNTGEYFEFYYDFTITVGLFDNDGNLLVQNKISPQGIRGIRRLFGIVDSNLIAKSAEAYFERAEYNQINFSPVKIDKIANGVNIKIINAKMSIFDRNNRKGGYDGYKQPPIISHDEWNALSN